MSSKSTYKYVFQTHGPKTYKQGRQCKTCGSSLSMYNPSKHCFACTRKRKGLDFEYDKPTDRPAPCQREEEEMKHGEVKITKEEEVKSESKEEEKEVRKEEVAVCKVCGKPLASGIERWCE